MPPAFRTNRDRLWGTLMQVGRIGALPGGGCCRLSLTEADGEARRLFMTWCEEAGCTISFDRVGNIYALRPGTEPDLPVVATGSHLDTQPHGGKFDGIYGVMAALEVLRTLNEQRLQTRRGVLAIVWTNEEGVRFSPPLAGSQAFTNRISAEAVLEAPTRDGSTVRDDLLRLGQLGDEVPGSRRFDSFFEAHIEQGPILEADSKTIGVVTHIQGMRAYRVGLAGEDGHAGTVPLEHRRDALLCAAEMIVRLRQLALEIDPQTKLTVGRLDVSPNSLSTIPGAVSFTIDLRHPDLETLGKLDACLCNELPAIGTRHRVEVDLQRVMESAPVPFNEALVETVQRCADRLGFSSRKMLSGAFHDAGFISKVAPTAMIFVPCERGISHNERENADPADLAAGTDVLLGAILERAMVV